MLYLTIIRGPLKGRQFPVKNRLTLGRKGTDIIFPDSKTSSKHAQIQLKNGKFYITDLGSRNGIKSEAKTHQSLQLQLGLEFIIGENTLKVIEIQDEPLEKPQLEKITPHISTDSPLSHNTPIPSSTPKQLTWQEEYSQLLESLIEKAEDKHNSSLKTFKKDLTLKFERGLQAETQWNINYGPKTIGAESLEYPIYEKGAPGLCFQVLQNEQGIVFNTPHPKVVLLNGKSILSDTLCNGDIIQILETQIKVEL